ncbi:MAG: hypothetical protein A2Y10_03905 [Planctomycetes bacterium GWF2_41_51]|nr:MAG: hypothetical protein A2Y10_03905 [Planctomycetes bacterium GWF2_41_51]HBG26015.1 hypothetical protein [Phycisphaerales bacterium]
MKKVVTFRMALFFLLLFLVLVGTTYAEITKWTYIYDGIWYASGVKTSPYTMYAKAIRIDLANPNVKITTTGGNGSAAGETTLQTPVQFLANNRLEVAVNANFFSGNDVQGLLIRNGVIVSSHQSNYPVQLRITSNKIASIVEAVGNPSGIRWAVAGDAYHLVNGTPLGAPAPRRARTSVGLSKDERFLIICVVDEVSSAGAAIIDMSHWMKDFGAHNAMNLDGGGSTCLVRSNTVNGSPVKLNPTSDASGTRKVGACLGAHSVARTLRHDIVIRGSSGDIKRKHRIGNNKWKTWQSLGQPDCGSASDPSIVSRKPGFMQVFVCGNNGRVYTKKYNGSWDSSWTNIGGDNLIGLDICSMNHDRIDVFAWCSEDNRLKQKTWKEDTGWGDWINRGGSLTSNPTAVSWGPDRIDIFVKNNNNKLGQLTYNGNNGWGDWYEHNKTMVGAPDAAAPEAGLLFVFWRDSSNHLKSMRTIGYLWGGLKDHGIVTGDPGATSRHTNTVTVFAPRADGNIWNKTWTPKGWGSKWGKGPGDSCGTSGVDACSWTNDAGTHQGHH